MKKIITIILMLTLMSSLAFAQEGKAMENKEQVINSAVQGLENAQLRVRTEEQKQHLNQVMEKIQEKQRIKLNKLSNLEFEEKEDEVIIKGKKEAKLFGLFRVQKTHRYTISEEGEIKYQKRFFDFFWKIDRSVE